MMQYRMPHNLYLLHPFTGENGQASPSIWISITSSFGNFQISQHCVSVIQLSLIQHADINHSWFTTELRSIMVKTCFGSSVWALIRSWATKDGIDGRFLRVEGQLFVFFQPI